MEVACCFCSKRSSYTCPQCNAQYCSSKCFKCPEHQKCSEKFFKGQVEDELKGAFASKESKEKMKEIFQRVNNDNTYEDALDSDDDEDLEDRMKNIDLNDSDAVWSRLSGSEKQDFLDIISSEKTADLIPPWEPWWHSQTPVTEIKDQKSKDVPSFMEMCPQVIDCPSISEITKTEPSPNVPFNILNVLTSYVWTVRLFNGDHQENCVDATEAVLSLSPVLSKAANFSSAEVAVCSPKMEAQNYSWLRESEEFEVEVRDDVTKILRGPNESFRGFYVSAALSDLISLFSSCKKALAPKRKERRGGAFSASVANYNQDVPKKFTEASLVKNSSKKIEFFLSFVKDFPERLFVDA